MMFSWKTVACLAVSLTLGAADKTPVTISHQGPVYWALPIYIADERGYFESLDLEVFYEVYSSGAPQVAAAVEDKIWDIGAAGVVPNIIGGPQDIETIGISNDESATNAIAATSSGVDGWPPAEDANATVAVTANSTAHFVVDECLVKEGILDTTNLLFGSPAEVLDALASDVEYGGLWAPHLYTFLESSEGSAVVCSGVDSSATVPGGIMVRKEFGDENGETVAKVLAAWLRGIEFIKDTNNRQQVLDYMEVYYALYNVSISESAMEKEIDERPIYGLDEQLSLMRRGNDTNSSASTVDFWYTNVGSFMESVGVLEENPDPITYITDKYMKLVSDNDTLRAFALNQGPEPPTIAPMPTAAPAAQPTVAPTSAGSSLVAAVVVAGVGVLTLGFVM